MKTLILYRSFLGSSKHYAEWLHEEIQSDIFKYGKVRGEVLRSYDTVVLVGGTYLGRFSLAGYLKDNWKVLQGKRVVFVTVAGTTTAESRMIIQAYARIPKNIRDAVKTFHLQSKVGEVSKEQIKPIAEYLKSK